MDINGWLTVISVFIAIAALLPKEEQKLALLGVSKPEKYLLFFILIFVLPLIISFPELSSRFKFLKVFETTWGLEPKNISFLLFFGSFLWLLARLIWFKPKIQVANSERIEYYTELLNERPFEDFFKLFREYVPVKAVKNQWEFLGQLIFQSKFVNGILVYSPQYLIQFWELFSKTQFKLIFRSLIENQNSVLCEEIREHWNSYSLLEGKVFLNKLLHENIGQSIDKNILGLISDFSARHLQTEQNRNSIYNQPHYFSRIREEEGFGLIIYYPIRLVGLLYSNAIENKVDIAAVSTNYGNMQSIYSGIIETMTHNISLNNINTSSEYPTNYHWLISEIFTFSSGWLLSFSHDYFILNSSYIDFIPFSISLSLKELYKGYASKKFSQNFINTLVHYNVLELYFDLSINSIMRESIERHIISEIPKAHIKPILDFSLNEHFAIDYKRFLRKDFGTADVKESESLNRLFLVLDLGVD